MQIRRVTLTVLLILGVLVGVWARGVQQEPDAPAPIRFSMAQQLWGGSTDPSLQAAFVELMEQATNTQIEMIAPPHSDYSQRLSVMLASGDLPDLFNIYAAMDNVPVFAQRGYLLALDNLLEDRDVLNGIYGDIYGNVAVVNGSTYAIPDGRNNLLLLFMRGDLLEAQGLDVPTTIDEFYDAAVTLKEVYDIIPLSNARFMSYFRYFLSSFGAYDDIVEDSMGHFSDGFDTPEMRAALTWLNQLYVEGLLDEEFVTNGTSTMREKLYSGQSAGSVYWDIFYTTYQIETEKNNPGALIVPVYRLAGPGGPGYTTDWGIDGAYGISSQTDYPDAALDIVEWFNTSEGYVARYSGVEGVHYTVNAAGEATPTQVAADSGYAINVFNFVRAPFEVDMPFSFGARAEQLAEAQFEVYQNGIAAKGPYHRVTVGKSEIYDRQRTAMSDKRQELAIQMIIGAMTVADGMAEWQAFWRSIDGDQMLEQING